MTDHLEKIIEPARKYSFPNIFLGEKLLEKASAKKGFGTT